MRGDVKLPPFTRLQNDFSVSFQRHLKEAVKRGSVFSHVRSHVVHEGQKNSIQREQGEIDETLMSLASAETTLTYEEIERFDVKALGLLIQSMAEQFRSAQTRGLVETLNAATERSGNIVSGKLDPEAVLRTLDSMEMSFNKGELTPDLVLLTHPDMEPHLRKIDEAFQNDPDLKRRHRELIRKKYEQFRSREMDRILVG
ncbi:hypothetical protein [Salinarimonas rosea]|uniref:hypothetical protein n=1 Tax=Salinarimonas rosea TaxID=552063 RepID=UPI0012EBC12E|nr:hypothetical protein [Salinarimonas rosea]